MHSDELAKTRIARTGGHLVDSATPGQACLVVLHAGLQSEIGRRYVFEKTSLTIGRGRDNDIVLMSDAVSRRHTRLELRDNEAFVVDLNSTNGTYVNDESRLLSERRLNRGDLLKVGDTIFKYLSGVDVEAQYHDMIFRMAVTDGLTNLCNRQQLDKLLSEEIQRCQRSPRPLAVLLLDIDHFKKINDEYGHLAGDSVLRGLASAMTKRMRPSDRLGRYGGEEFCILLPDTSLDGAASFAEGLRALAESCVFAADERQIRVTISVGVAQWSAGMMPMDMYRAADEKLYAAKHNGRNRVES
ncbi:MAG TPA: GGDEF domain-containing protein [Steroidobacteraceae bacterium]|jgi:diguanylate cyclase (GGDEF)-like protein|nr:GGDEF domain-containing protein [Steroidobacteraceae bacterium]